MFKGMILFVAQLAFAISAHANSADETALYLDALFNGDIQTELSTIEPMAVRTLVTRNVGPSLRTYTANVPNCAEGLTHVRVIVSRADVKVHGGGANFSNGDQKNVNFSRTLSEGYTSPWISTSYLGANGRCVKSVYVKAQAANAGETSRVEVQGRYN